jgi:hypothetical protein
VPDPDPDQQPASRPTFVAVPDGWFDLPKEEQDVVLDVMAGVLLRDQPGITDDEA